MVFRSDGLSTINVLSLKIHSIRKTLLSPFYRWGRNMQKDSVTQRVLIHLGVESSTSAATAEPAIPLLNSMWQAAPDIWYLNGTLLACRVPKSLHKNGWIAFFPICLCVNTNKFLWRHLTHCNEFLSWEKDQICEMLWDSWVEHLPNFKAWLNTVAVCS